MLKDLYVEMTLYQERMHRKSKKKFRDYLHTKAQELNLPIKLFPKAGFPKMSSLAALIRLNIY